MKTENALVCSKKLTTYFYHEPDERSPCPHILFLQDPFYYHTSIYAYVLQVMSLRFAHQSPIKHFCSPPYVYVPHASLISSFF
jgi:hypothetical protein